MSKSSCVRYGALGRQVPHLESGHSDALFYNPFARQLAGERGAKIVRDLAASRRRSWPILVRTPKCWTN